MDRKGLIGVVVCIVLYFVLTGYFNAKYPHPAHRPAVAAAAGAAALGTNGPTITPASTTSALTSNPAVLSNTPNPAVHSATAEPTVGGPEKLDFLDNEYVKVTLTSHGAAIKSIELKKHSEGNTSVILNEGSHDAVMAVSGWPEASFTAQTTPASIAYTATLPDGVKWTRTYTLGKDYLITVADALANGGTSTAVLPPYSVSVGRAKPLLVESHWVKKQYQSFSSQYIGAGWLTTSSKYHLTTISAFEPTGFLTTTPGRDVISSTTIDPNPLRWLGVQNQFFAVLLTPDDHHPIAQATFQAYNQRDANGKIPTEDPPDIEAFADFPELHLPTGQATTVNYSLYAGPREYNRLSALGDNQGELMNYDGFLPFSLLIVPMLGVLHYFNSITGSYGLAIILLTLVIKGITWPLQSIANRSGKRMQAVAPKIKELQAKFKEQPEKLNTETFALYREYGVNPFGGCLPAFIQMPVFFSLYYMLQNAVELRGRHFLWVQDLTQPDTIFSVPLGFSFFSISHFTINPLPVMVTFLMMVMMRMTPQMGDPQQQKIAQFMPLFFLFLFYNFAAALSLYYVINNSVAIIQIYRNLKKPLPELKKKVKPVGK